MYLQSAAFAIRSNQCYGSIFSPSKLVLGDKLVHPIDVFASDSNNKSFVQKQAQGVRRRAETEVEVQQQSGPTEFKSFS